jgi:chromosome segregation ATPase
LNDRDVAASGKLDQSLRTELQEAVNRLQLRDLYSSISRSQRKCDETSMKKLAELVASCGSSLQQQTSQLLSEIDTLDDLREKLAVLQRHLVVTKKEIDTVCTNQSRLRDNLERLKEHPGSVVVRRYLEDMNRDEDTLIAARKKIVELEDAEIALKKSIAGAEAVVKETAYSLQQKC